MKTVNVEFKKGGKQYIFFDNDLELAEGDNVIVETERGQQFGSIASINTKSDNKDHSLVLKVATRQDERQNQKFIWLYRSRVAWRCPWQIRRILCGVRAACVHPNLFRRSQCWSIRDEHMAS